MLLLGFILCGIAGGLAGYHGGVMGIVAVVISQAGMVLIYKSE